MSKSYDAEAIVRIRIDRGYKRADDLADAAGISISTLHNIESGRKKALDSDMLVALCRTLGASPYDFLPGLRREWDELEAARLELIERLKSMGPA